jgi:hypothetical protein
VLQRDEVAATINLTRSIKTRVDMNTLEHSYREEFAVYGANIYFASGMWQHGVST